MIVNKLLTVRDNNSARRTITCQRGQIIWQVTTQAELAVSLRPAAGFEPATFRLQVGCTTTVLCWRLVLAGRFFYSLTDYTL